MPNTTTWMTRHAVTRAYGCDLAVMWRGPDAWAWLITVAGEHVASGTARTMGGAQDTALRAAKAHTDNGGRVQLPLL